MALTAIVTNAGRAALVNASNTGTAPVTIAQVGLTATAVVPGVGITALPGEYKRVATISGDVVADDTIHLIVRDESADVFTVRSFALYLADGTLFAVYGQAGVILEKSAQAMMLLAIDVQFADVAAAMLTFGNANFLNPPATTEIQGVVELATVGEAQAGIDALRALTPAAAKAAILGWLLAQDGSGSGLDADLLDGQDGSYYSNIPQRLGYTPVNKAGDTMTGSLSLVFAGGPALTLNSSGVAIGKLTMQNDGNLMLYRNAGSGDAAVFGVNSQTGPFTVYMPMTRQGNTVWDAGNDGSGSGLDADLLDGQDGSYYSNITQRLGFTPLNKAGDTASGRIGFTGGVTGNNSLATATSNLGEIEVRGNGNGAAMMTFHRPNSRAVYFGLDTDNSLKIGGWSLGATAYTMWHSGNDGAGSGLDADLLDGYQASQFMRNNNSGWVASEEGTPRFFFSASSSTYARINTSFRWQNTASSDVASLDESGNIWLNGQIDTTRVLCRANGDGQAVKIGDDAWLGDVNISNGLRITGVQNADRGYLCFGNADVTVLGRIGTGPLTYNGYTLWHAGNDGSGSGLDADLLDGQDGSYYSNVTARLGYTPVNKAGDTISGQLTAGGLVNNSSRTYFGRDGGGWHWFAGAGLPAEPGSLAIGFASDGTNITTINFMINGGAKLQLSSSGATISGNAVWHAGNDGSGSGLDADLIDGYQASDLAKMADFANNLSAAGYQKLAGGAILQWCTTATQQNVETTTTATFPIQFPNAVLDVQLTTRVDIASVEADTWYQLVGDPSLSGCTVMRARSDNDADRPSYCRIFALGR